MDELGVESVSMNNSQFHQYFRPGAACIWKIMDDVVVVVLLKVLKKKSTVVVHERFRYGFQGETMIDDCCCHHLPTGVMMWE
jgi:hypothetical protein